MLKLVNTDEQRKAVGILMLYIASYILKNKIRGQWQTIIFSAIVIAIVYLSLKKLMCKVRLRYQKDVYVWAFNCGVAMVITQLVLGFVGGFGRSPYSSQLRTVIVNLLYASSSIVARELVRAYCIHAFWRKNKNKWILPVIVIVLTLLSINLSAYTRINSMQRAIAFLSGTLLPLLGENILATYLVAYGGGWASCIYLMMVAAFEWLSPILPDPNWLLKGALGCGVPIVCVLNVNNSYKLLNREIKLYKEPPVEIVKNVTSAVFSILLVWFAVGVFPIYPTVIVTGSMQPVINPGDIVLARRIQTVEEMEMLDVGDIIQYTRGDILVTHQIIEVIEEEDIRGFRTKGENNSREDFYIVEWHHVKGELHSIIPKIGKPVLWLRIKQPLEEEVEF